MDAVDNLGRPFVVNLLRLAEIIESAGVPFAVIGASAFLLHDVDLSRTTRDLDLAVAIEGGLDAVRGLLLDAGLSSTRIDHRFRTHDGSEIDVLALDPTWSPEHEIRLADGETLHAIGLPEGLRHAVSIVVGNRAVPVMSLPMLIAMKLVGASSGNRPHDLEDACAAMAAYEQSGDRRFDLDYERFDDLSFETAGALLAGLDAARMIGAATREAFDGAAERLLMTVQLSDRFAHGPLRRRLVLAFRTGLDAESSSGTERCVTGAP
ncbi:hypothetical protein KJ567_00880 [Candidatus Bipolaricaulota bacterium]|nr:hypothetical protein [Candidatus Bipolaricaulota bacterium]